MIYYLSVRHGDRIVRDDEGSDLPDLETARREAIITARVMMAQAILEGHDISASLSVEIADANGLVVAVVPFTDAVRAVGPRPSQPVEDSGASMVQTTPVGS